MGFRNNYSERTPFFEQVLKDILCLIRETFFYFRNGFSLPVWIAYPTYPSKKTTLYKLALLHRVRLTNKLVKNPTKVFYFEDVTYGSSNKLISNYPNLKITNINCTDISKSKVNEIHKQVFGYDLHIDPLSYTGFAVEKSEVNAVHDGKTIICPIAPNEIKIGSVYQLIIDNKSESDEFVDIRVPVIFGEIPLVYLKFKSEEKRFTNDMHRATYHETSEILTKEEEIKCLEFAEAMGAEFCELDVLRNKADERIYVVDLNKTPFGPPSKLSEENKTSAIIGISKSIKSA